MLMFSRKTNVSHLNINMLTWWWCVGSLTSAGFIRWGPWVKVDPQCQTDCPPRSYMANVANSAVFFRTCGVNERVDTCCCFLFVYCVGLVISSKRLYTQISTRRRIIQKMTHSKTLEEKTLRSECGAVSSARFIFCFQLVLKLMESSRVHTRILRSCSVQKHQAQCY